jgi:hypothetical protein
LSIVVVVVVEEIVIATTVHEVDVVLIFRDREDEQFE